MKHIWGLPLSFYLNADGVVTVTNKSFLKHLLSVRDKRLIYRGPENDNRVKSAIEV